MMEMHFEEFLFISGLPWPSGHIGVLSTQMFYDAASDLYFIMNFGNTNAMSASFQALSEVLRNISAKRSQ